MGGTLAFPIGAWGIELVTCLQNHDDHSINPYWLDGTKIRGKMDVLVDALKACIAF